MSDKYEWKIRIPGYGTFTFNGTEVEADAAMRAKAGWEGATGIMYRVDLPNEYHRLTKQIVDLWDAGEGVSIKLMRARAKAKGEIKPEDGNE